MSNMQKSPAPALAERLYLDNNILTQGTEGAITSAAEPYRKEAGAYGYL